MNLIDMRTIFLTQIMTDALCTLVMALLWFQNRRRFPGIGYWLLDFALQTAAILLILLRGVIPDWLSMTVSNAAVIVGSLLGYVGLARFAGKRVPQAHNVALVLLFIAVHIYFEVASPSIAARNLNVSLTLLAICAQCVWLVARGFAPGARRGSRSVALVFFLFCLVSLIRVGVIVAKPPTSQDLFRSGSYDTLVLLSYKLLLIALTFALTLMINGRLLREIRSEEEKFATIFRLSPYAITLSRMEDGRLLDANEAFQKISGYSSAEAIGESAVDLRLWAAADNREEVVRDLAAGRRVFGREFLFRRKSGELLTGLFSAEIVDLDGRPSMLASIADITENKRAAEELRAQAEGFAAELERRVALRTAQLEAASEELEAFAYSVSHDLRSPLRAVDGFARILADEYGYRLDDEGRRICSVIGEGAGEMGRLIDDLLAFTKLGRSAMRREAADMEALARSAFLEAAGSEDRARIDFRLGPLSAAHGDARRLGQVWLELLSNAVKFSSKKERAVIEVAASESEDEIVYSVRDNGAGFDMAFAHKLFRVFQRLHGATEYPGRGVGLAMVHRIIGRHGGRVWAEGRPGEGATFSFSLPRNPRL